MLSLTSTSTSDARSMFEYDLTASTSPEMRPTLASASASKSAVVIAAPRYSSTLGSATSGTAASTPSSQTVSSPAPAIYRGDLEAGVQFAVLQPARYLVFEVAPPKWVEGGGRGGPHYSLPFESGESFELFGGQCAPQLHR